MTAFAIDFVAAGARILGAGGANDLKIHESH
jgi:hypothetical protein